MFDFDDIEEDVKRKGTAAWAESKAAVDEVAVSTDILRFAQGAAPAKAAAVPEAPKTIAAPAIPGRVLPELMQSEWLGTYRRNPEARVRLFAVLGVGCPAATYTDWVSPKTLARFPGIEVAVLELPGHGFNSAQAYYEPTQAGKGIAATISSLQFRDQQKGEKRPFALYGFSMGALLLWDAARQIRGGEGETCSKLYVSSRGAPHLTSPPTQPKKADDKVEKDEEESKEKPKAMEKDKEESKEKPKAVEKDEEESKEKPKAVEKDKEESKEKPKVTVQVKPKVKKYGRKEYKVKMPLPGERPDFSKEDPQELFDFSMGNFESTVDKAQLQKYDKYLSMLLKRDPKKLAAFVETQFSDSMIASRGIDTKKQKLPLKVTCPLQFYHSDGDEVWPPETTLGGPDQLYENLVKTWEPYAPSKQTYAATHFPGVPHGDMGSPTTPAFEHMMEDLSKLVAAGGL